jgi:anti-sigma factor RsiW
MSDIICGYSGDRDAALMEYLFGEMTAEDRSVFDGHLVTCARCRTELAAFGTVRRQLANWSPPEIGSTSSALLHDDVRAQRETSRGPIRLRNVPVWAQVAAAIVVLGVSAGLANLNVHYDTRNGLNIRTGWRRDVQRADIAAPASRNEASTSTAVSNIARDAATATPWRADLVALERQLRSEMHAVPVGPAAVTHAPAGADQDLMRRVKVLVDESERKQQRELALRVTALIQDLNAQRQADLRRIDQNLGLIQDRTGVEVLRNRQMIDYYMQRVSQRP